MVEPLPTWARAFAAAVALAGLALAVAHVLDDGLGPARPADWWVAPTADLRPSSDRIAVVVHERDCSSGRSAEGRIEAAVTYEAEAVVIDIGVRRRSGGQDCQGNPGASYVVELDEPLGDRRVEGERPLPRDAGAAGAAATGGKAHRGPLGA